MCTVYAQFTLPPPRRAGELTAPGRRLLLDDHPTALITSNVGYPTTIRTHVLNDFWSPTQFCFLYAMRYAVSCSVPKHSQQDHLLIPPLS
jgi:hypothetical protein